MVSPSLLCRMQQRLGLEKTPQAFKVSHPFSVRSYQELRLHPPSCPTSSGAQQPEKTGPLGRHRASLQLREAHRGVSWFPTPHPAACSQPSPGPTFLDCGILQGSGEGSPAMLGGLQSARLAEADHWPSSRPLLRSITWKHYLCYHGVQHHSLLTGG